MSAAATFLRETAGDNSRRSASSPRAAAQAPRVADVDVAILGGGCAGLSLAYRLAGSGLSVEVVEPRREYVADRTWSFWRTRPDPFEDCVVARWSRWRVTAGDRRVERTSRDLRYQSVSAGLFYDKCLARIAASRNISLSLGASVRRTVRAAEGTWVETDRRAFTASHVVDTRPVRRKPAYAQSFVGREIRTAAPLFDPGVVDLMAFRPPNGRDIPFTYVLPFAPDRALVEATVFGPDVRRPADLTADLEAALADRLAGAAHEVIREEAGVIPMDAAHREVPADPGAISLGLRGGGARPSTGYAFARIQQMAERAADSLIAGAAVPSLSLDGPVTRHMDRLFLEVLKRNPQRGPDLFADLFKKAAPDRLERFLSGSTAPLDRLAAVAALPPGLFIRAALLP